MLAISQAVVLLSLHLRYRDEDGEPLMDYDDMPSDRERSPDAQPQPDHFLDDTLDDDIGERDNWRSHDWSQTPPYDTDPSASKSKPRKRLIKKSSEADGGGSAGFRDFDDDGEGYGATGEAEEFVREGSDEERKMKRKKMREAASGKKEKRHKSGSEKKFGSKSGFSKRGMDSSGKGSRDRDGEVKEMWDTIAGGDSEVACSFYLFFSSGKRLKTLMVLFLNILLS